MARPVHLPPLVTSDTPNKSSRHGAAVRLIVPHTVEGSYEAGVSWLKNPSAQASAHIVLNENGTQATQLVGWDEKSWACADFNAEAENIECAGKLTWPNQLLGHNMKQMRVLARIVAFRLRKRGLPPKWVQNKDRFHGRGVARHGDLAPEGGHPLCKVWRYRSWFVFMGLVKYEYRRRHFRERWGR